MKLVSYEKAAYELAHRIAAEALSKDKYQHTLRVVEYTKQICARDIIVGEEETVCIILAFLHDVIEDSDKYTLEDIEQIFGSYIARCVERLTHKKDECSYEEYIDSVLASSSAVVTVKRADMKDHLCQKETLTPKLKEKYLGVLDKFM